MQIHYFLAVVIAFVSFAVPAAAGQSSNENWESTGQRGRKTLFAWPENNQGGKSAEDSDDEEEIEPLATDRPDFTEASSTVGRGVTQIEFGYTYFEDREPGIVARNHSCGEPLLRVGLWRDWFEFRAGVFPLIQTHDVGGVGSRDSGVEDLYLGCKLGLTEQAGWLPEMALTPQMTIPSGSDAFTNDRVLPGANFLYGWDVTDRISFAGSSQFNVATHAASDSYTEWAQSLTVGYGFTDRLRTYQEWFGLFPDDGDTVPVEHYFNGGLTFLLSPDVQWDIRAGVGLSDAATDYFAGTGLSIRFRPR